MPASPAELRATVQDPMERFRLVTVLANVKFNGWLPPDWRRQRLADLHILLHPDPEQTPAVKPRTQSEIAKDAKLTRQCVNALARRLPLGESPA